MPYCDTVFQTVKPEQVENVLSKFAQERFVSGQVAYRLDDGSFLLMRAFTIASFKLFAAKHGTTSALIN